jgi:DNA-binding NarL/FixJ family response regulator
MPIGSVSGRKAAVVVDNRAGAHGGGWRLRPRAVVVDANGMLADLLAASLSSLYEMEVAARVSTAEDGVAACVDGKPDLLVLNPDLPDGQGIDVIRALAAANPAGRVIVVAGGAGLAKVRRNAALPPQVHAIVDVAAGLPAFSLEIAQLLEAMDRAPPTLRVDRILSGRELDVFELIGQGLMNAAIADELGIRLQTVETHRKSVAKKLGATGVELVRLAVLHVAAHGRARPDDVKARHR